MASRPLLTPACFYLCKGDLIKPQEKKKSKTRSRCASESTAWTINSFVSGRGCPNCWHATPAMMDFFVSACHVGNLIWILMALPQTLTLSWSHPGIPPVITPGLWTTSLSWKGSWWILSEYHCLMSYLPVMMPLRIGAKPHHTLPNLTSSKDRDDDLLTLNKQRGSPLSRSAML